MADRNDHSPTFEEKSYVFSAPENSDVGHVIGAVQARDEDKGRNGEIQYRLRTTIKKFTIEASSGKTCLFSQSVALVFTMVTGLMKQI